MPSATRSPCASEQRLLKAEVKLAKDVDPRALAAATDGLSGWDLKQLRDKAGMRAFGRIKPASPGASPARRKVNLSMADFDAALSGVRGRTSLAKV